MQCSVECWGQVLSDQAGTLDKTEQQAPEQQCSRGTRVQSETMECWWCISLSLGNLARLVPYLKPLVASAEEHSIGSRANPVCANAPAAHASLAAAGVSSLPWLHFLSPVLHLEAAF